LSPRIGTDEWVAQAEARTEGDTGLLAVARRRFEAVPAGLRFAPFVVVVALIPSLTSSDYIIRVALDTLLFALLALGLNIVVGWAGLLDLGYVAFYGFGAYGYAAVSSEHFGLHWPTEASIPAVFIACAALGFLVGLPSRRVFGDYLAIVTLFFGQIFVTVTRSGNRVELPGTDRIVDFTGGPNGLVDVDQFNIFGIDVSSLTSYLYFTLAAFVLVASALWVLNDSRTGRAWRSIYEDELASELMGTPIIRLKLLAFAFGAAIAGLAGTVFAAVQTGAFPGDFDLPLLITVYAMVILGGAGSIVGVVSGAIVINVLLEVLRSPDQARWVFYGILVAALVWKLRPWQRLGAVLIGTVGLGFLVHAIVDALWERGTARPIQGGGLADALERWMVLPTDPQTIGNVAFVVLIAAVIVLRELRGHWRTAALVASVYLAAFTWENRLVLEPSITRLILLGAALVALMAVRPEGLFGRKRVEIT
jgi:ABC-type branched-subunit amino acid transport system permease subunit